jgi:hypothetical protein
LFGGTHHQKLHHPCNRRAKRKYKNQNQLLTEVVVPVYVQNNLLTHHDVEKDILVFDRGDSNNPPIKPPNGVNWQQISISGEKFIVTLDQNDHNCGLTYAHLDETRPFIRMPQVQSLSLLGDKGGMISNQNDLNTCKRIKKSPLLRSSAKRIFGDYGKPPMYTCARLQVSQNSHEVLDAAPFMNQRLLCHWKVVMQLMQRADYCFESIADHQVISHMCHMKKVVPFKTMNIPSCKSVTLLNYYGDLAFGCNVFL